MNLSKKGKQDSYFHTRNANLSNALFDREAVFLFKKFCGVRYVTISDFSADLLGSHMGKLNKLQDLLKSYLAKVLPRSNSRFMFERKPHALIIDIKLVGDMRKIFDFGVMFMQKIYYSIDFFSKYCGFECGFKCFFSRLIPVISSLLPR